MARWFSIGYFLTRMETIEVNGIDLRLERTRLHDTAAERALLDSIACQGILDPLCLVGSAGSQRYVLIDGFKRYRCARKLGMGMVPAEFVADDVATGIVTFIRRNEYGGGITVLEQAALIEELHRRCGMSIYDIAHRLGHSPSWVSMRLGVLDDLSALVRSKLLSGAFPARAYLYGIKGFTRVNNIARERVDAFVAATSGKGLSTRDLFVLSRSFFTGGSVIERLVLEGDVHRALQLLTADIDGSDDVSLTDKERLFIKDLQSTAAGMSRITANGGSMHIQGGLFSQYVNLWSNALLKRLSDFSATIRELYDRSGPHLRGAHPVPSGSEPQGDCAAVAN
jgi:ParB/RepB/Spo0J family partition protein